jgi:hypothetical protein
MTPIFQLPFQVEPQLLLDKEASAGGMTQVEPQLLLDKEASAGGTTLEQVTPSPPAVRVKLPPNERPTPQGIEMIASASELPLNNRVESLLLVEKVCQGWTSLKFDPLFQRAYHDAFKSSRTMENAMLQLPVLFLPFRSPGAKELVFVADGTRGYALLSIQCTRVFVDSSWRRVLCDACHCLTKTVSTICQQSTARTSRPINCTTRVEDVSPSKLPQLIDVVRKRKRYEAHNATRREQRLKERLFDQSVPLEFEEDKNQKVWKGF